MVRRVRQYMTAQVITLSPDSTMEEAVLLEVKRRIRHIPIVDKGQLVGIVTDRDIKRAMPSLLTGTDRDMHERVTKNTRIAQIMTRSPLTIAPDLPLRQAVTLLQERRIGALPVVEKNRLVGILTESDCLRALAEMLAGEA
jgi:acetoin utilization protein AcuB